MNQLAKLVNFALVLLQLIDTINSVELTFELPDNSKECFYQDIAKNKSAVLEFQVKRILSCDIVSRQQKFVKHRW